jgi:hypothetical protein
LCHDFTYTACLLIVQGISPIHILSGISNYISKRDTSGKLECDMFSADTDEHMRNKTLVIAVIALPLITTAWSNAQVATPSKKFLARREDMSVP